MRDRILMAVLGMAFLLNILAINLLGPTMENLVPVGYIVLGVGGAFYVASVLTLGRKGISDVVDSGIYGIVRHPMYVGVMIMFGSHVVLGQNWLVLIGTLAAIVCSYLIIQSDDQRNIEKFGDDYRRYMERVPKVNLLVGTVRFLRRRKQESQA
jgi:protein-S-isoprenylcysteine O-methyltransferase Ste14